MNTTIKRQSSGFTIIELLVVIVVIGILATAIIISYVGVNQKATVASMQSDLATASQQLKMYYTDHGAYPTNIVANCPTGPSDPTYCLRPSQNNSFVLYNSPGNRTTFTLQVTNSTTTVAYGVSESSKPTLLAPLTAVAISGVAGTGNTLSTTLTPSDGSASYQWQISATCNGTYVDISAATSQSYVPVLGDKGGCIRVKATGVGFSTGNATSTATAAVIAYAPNGNYYMSFDGTLRFGANVAASGATYGSYFTFYWSESTGDVNGNPVTDVLADKTGVHLHGNLFGAFDHNFILQNGQVFRPTSVITIHQAPDFLAGSGFDPDDGQYEAYDTPVGVEASYVNVQ